MQRIVPVIVTPNEFRDGIMRALDEIDVRKGLAMLKLKMRRKK